MLEDFLMRQRAAIVDDWFEQIITEYPPETARFLRSQQDRFANPVGAGLREALGPLLDEVLSGSDDDRLQSLLDRIIRVRAVQDFRPSQALDFLIGLKRIIRDRVVEAGLESSSELAELDRRIDDVMLAAFDVYSGCREQVCEIRIKEIRNRSLKNMERLNEWRARRNRLDGDETVEPH